MVIADDDPAVPHISVQGVSVNMGDADVDVAPADFARCAWAAPPASTRPTSVARPTRAFELPHNIFTSVLERDATAATVASRSRT